MEDLLAPLRPVLSSLLELAQPALARLVPLGRALTQPSLDPTLALLAFAVMMLRALPMLAPYPAPVRLVASYLLCFTGATIRSVALSEPLAPVAQAAAWLPRLAALWLALQVPAVRGVLGWAPLRVVLGSAGALTRLRRLATTVGAARVALGAGNLEGAILVGFLQAVGFSWLMVALERALGGASAAAVTAVTRPLSFAVASAALGATALALLGGDAQLAAVAALAAWWVLVELWGALLPAKPAPAKPASDKSATDKSATDKPAAKPAKAGKSKPKTE